MRLSSFALTVVSAVWTFWVASLHPVSSLRLPLSLLMKTHTDRTHTDDDAGTQMRTSQSARRETVMDDDGQPPHIQCIHEILWLVH
eukprot:COSAG01_NODE_50212_length_365_cov_0.778195_1_plen_85_part_10